MPTETNTFSTPTNIPPTPKKTSGGFAQINLNNSTPPVYQTQSFGQQLQNTNQVVGAYGQYGARAQRNPAPTQTRPVSSTGGARINPATRSLNPALNPNRVQNPANLPVRQPQPNYYPPTQSQTQNPANTQPKNTQRPQKLDPNSIEYLQKLSAADLRKEVIKTEIEIQRTLIQSEKAYREGVSTIRDLIAPSSVKITTGQLELGTKIVRSFFVLTYPRVINSGWLEGIVNADIPMDLSIFIYPRDSSEVLKELKSKVGKIQASLQINTERGAARDPALETAYRDVEGLRDAIQQGVEKFFRVGVYISIYADNVDELEKSSQAVEGILNQQNIMMKRAALQMDDGFNSSLPILKDDLSVLNNMNTSPLSACFPFVSSELSSDTGILYGINRHNTSLIIFDRFELENANSLIFATSGAGKSYAVKLEILRSLMMGVSVIVIDPEQEYKVLADTLGGAYVNFSLNSTSRINPFDLPKPLPGENIADILRTAVIDLMGLMGLMLGKMTPEEISIMERAIQECYAKRDITAYSNLADITPPTMSDLVDILNGIVGGESLAQRLYRYTQGTFAGIFNQRTNININNEFIVFNIRDLQDTLRPIAMYILLKYIWNEIRSTLKRRILAIDEAWIMMQYEDSARFLYGLVKRARKYYLGITTITQDVGDFLGSPFGKPIVTNAAMKLLLKQSTAAIDGVADAFALTSGEKQVLLQSEVGQGIFFAGPRHVAIEIVAFPTEHRIITTNPKDILKQQGLDDEAAAGENQ
jgi:conjugal transfer ATP-binding protein TraC